MRLAWRPGAFFDAVKALALLAEAENESWANNATGEFLGRFQIFLGGTAVPYLERLAVIDELVALERVPLVRLAVKALARVGERRAHRMGSEPASDELPEKEWHPSTERERLECVLTALKRLTNLAGRGIAELESDFVSAAKDLAMMLRDAPVRSAVSALFESVRTAYPETREPLRRTIAHIVYRERKYWNQLSEEEVAELEILHAEFEDASLPARLQQVVGQSHWDRDEQSDLQPLAKELAESPATLAEMWPWLTSGDAADGWRFGEALAEQDTKGQLLETIQNAELTGRDLRVLCGYVSATRRRRGDDWYDSWFQAQSHRTPRPLNMLFEVASRCGATPLVARCVREILRAESVAPEIVGQLSIGRWGEDLPPNLLSNLLRTMVGAGHEATALTILEHRIQSQPGEHGRWLGLALELIAIPSLIRSDQMISYYWKELALRYVDEQPGEIAAAIIREQGNRSARAWFVEHSDAAQVLYACVERSPDGVWRLLEPQLSSKVGASRFSIGFPRGVLERMPVEQVVAWVDADPDERASIVARLASKSFANDDTLASRIVGTYGDRDDVASAFFSVYVSGSWSGSASAHWEQLATAIEEVSKRTKLPKLRRWAADAARELRQMAERDRQREEEEDLRGH